MRSQESERGGLAGRARHVYVPRRAAVEAEGGVPVALEGVAVEAVREDWLVEDRWWTARPLHRRYYELVLAGGRCAVVFRDLRTGCWHSQPA